METSGSEDAAGLPGALRREPVDAQAMENLPVFATSDDNGSMREDNFDAEPGAARQSSSIASTIESAVPTSTSDGDRPLHENEASESSAHVVVIHDEAADPSMAAEDQAQSGLVSETIDSGEENAQVSDDEGAEDNIVNIDPAAAMPDSVGSLGDVHPPQQQQLQEDNVVEQNDEGGQGDEEPPAHNCSRAFADKANHFANWGTVAAGIGFCCLCIFSFTSSTGAFPSYFSAVCVLSIALATICTSLGPTCRPYVCASNKQLATAWYRLSLACFVMVNAAALVGTGVAMDPLVDSQWQGTFLGFWVVTLWPIVNLVFSYSIKARNDKDYFSTYREYCHSKHLPALEDQVDLLVELTDASRHEAKVALLATKRDMADAVETVTLAKFIEDTDLCVICSDSLKEIVFRPCRHFCVCVKCSGQVQQCPMCRCDVGEHIRIAM